MKYIAKHYIKTPEGTITYGEVFDGKILSDEQVARLKRLGAIKELAPLPFEVPDDEIPEGDETGDEVFDEEIAEDETGDEEDEEEVRNIDASEGLIAPEPPEKPEKKPARKTPAKTTKTTGGKDK